jgi:hypothetical protein
MKKIIASISVTKSNATDIEKKYADYDVIEGMLEVTEGAAISLPKASMLGDIIARENSIITLPAVKETGHVFVYRGAMITLTSATKTRDVTAYREAKITLPSAIITTNVSAGQDAAITLPAAIRTGGVMADEDATISLPKAETVGLVMAEEGSLISLLSVKNSHDITAKEGAIIVVPCWVTLSSPGMHIHENALLVNGFVDPRTAESLELVKAMAIAWAENRQISVADAELRTLSLAMMEKGHQLFYKRIWVNVTVPLSSVLKQNVS